MTRPSLERIVEGVRRSDRSMLARAITWIESERRDDRRGAQEILTRLAPQTGGAIRLGITGVPGVGKSTFIDALGMHLVDAGHRVAVLAVDPTSARSGGSILGDKTRMVRLSRDPRAFIRPSPSQGALGGVARKTRESILLCEAAGHDVVLVETVGVGQSEVEVAQMVDCFLVLMLPNAGDDLQGIKRGILELADLIAVNKADGDQRPAAERARRHYEAALHYTARGGVWTAEVHCVSAQTGDGVAELWQRVLAHRDALTAVGALAELRATQAVAWMWRAIDHELSERLRTHPTVVAVRDAIENDVRRGAVPATAGAIELLRRFGIDP